MLLPFALGAALIVVHYLSERVHLLGHVRRMRAVSFTAGTFIASLILHLLPDLFTGNQLLDRAALLAVLAGFSAFHLLERWVYRHEASHQEALRRELKELHAVAFFTYHLAIGIVLVGVAAKSAVSGMLFFIPVSLIAAVSSLSLKEVHGAVRQNRPAKAALSLSTLLGISLGAAVALPGLIHSLLFGFIAGALLFTVVADSIPRERKGDPLFFIVGAGLYALLIGLTWAV